ncbi:MAG: hypothetical protein ACTSQF_09380 [Candidatus Heimdallarchaeaceae archaeon]
MKKKAILGSALLGLTFILLTMSGSVSQVAINYINNDLDALTLNPVFVEDMRVTAAIDSAAVVALDLVGGDLPAIALNPLFDDVKSWGLIASNQAGYADYVLRRPFKSPDNATLLVEMNGGLTPEESLVKAVQVALLFDAAYGLNLMWTRAEVLPGGSYLYYFTGAMGASIFTSLITEIQTDITGGFATILDPVEINASPVKCVLIGAVVVVDLVTPIRGVYYIDTDAITGTTDFTLSTNNLFGENLVSATDPLVYSTLKFRFPYTINPISISPPADNFAPQITGKMDWNLNAPWMLSDASTNYEVVYNINHTELVSSPRVSVNMAYDQDMLNNDGRLQMDYVVTNTGTEAATDIDISYPLGPDFLDFLATKPNVFILRDDVTITDTNYSNAIHGTVLMQFEGALFPDVAYPDMVYEQDFLILYEWYQNNTDMSMVDINPANTDVVVKSDFATYVIGDSGDVITTVSLSSPNGIPTALINACMAYLAPIDLPVGNPTDVIDTFMAYMDTIAIAAQDSADYLFNLLYTEQTIFDPVLMDFEFTNRTVGFIGDAEYRKEVFLSTTIPFLDVGESVNVSWALDNIPAKDMSFGMMGLAPVNVGASYGALQLSTMERTGYDLLQFLFGVGDDNVPLLGDKFSRPLSYYEHWTGLWLSAGARYSYNDAQGFEYYGFSNGINLQIADDEAVLNVQVSLNQTAYVVGDPVTVYYSIENTGNLPAEDVVLGLYHGRMGADWQIKDPQLFWIDEIGTINNGTTYANSADVIANSFLGIHPVYAVVAFTSDKGQTVGNEGNIDFAPGLTSTFTGAAETAQIIFSNMDWGLVLPETEDRRPAFPQPVIEIAVDVDFIIEEGKPWELLITIEITNVGEELTHVTAIQFYNASEMQLLYKSSTPQGYTMNGTRLGIGVILFQGITLHPGESVALEMRWLFLTSQGCYIPGIIIIYDSRYENELGNEGVVDTTPDVDEPLVYAMDGTAQDEEEWEEYGQSTQTGSSAGADAFAGGDYTRKLGAEDIIFWSLSAVFVTAFATKLKSKKK